MKYISLFSGIGGFELAIHNLFPEATCLGFSEVDGFALQVYQHHFPSHLNLGDVTSITEEAIRDLVIEHKGCDLLVGGFPCTNLTSLSWHTTSANSDGLDGPKSGLFWDMIRIIGYIRKYNEAYDTTLHLIVENNASMKKVFRDTITTTLQHHTHNLFLTMLNGFQFGVQKRRRLYWTTFEVGSHDIKCSQTWNDVLLPITDPTVHDAISIGYIRKGNKLYPDQKSCKILTLVQRNNTYEFEIDPTMKGYSSIWQRGLHSDTSIDKCSPVICGRQFENILIDRRVAKGVLPRFITGIEAERLFFFPDGWVSDHCSKTRTLRLLGNTVIVRVIEYILTHSPFHKQSPFYNEM